MGNFSDLELDIARARILLSVATLISIYVDPNVPDMTPWIRLTGGPLVIDRFALAALSIHLAYSIAVHAGVRIGSIGASARRWVTALDIVFACLVTVFTEGPISPSFVFFVFAIIATGCREGFRSTMFVTLASSVSYFVLVSASAHASTSVAYLTRPIYLALTGYFIAYLGQLRVGYEAALRERDRRDQRQSIARSLHDGFIQSLSGVRLRLVACHRMIAGGDTTHGLAELAALESEVAHEYDEARAYVRSLADIEDARPRPPERSATRFDLDLRFSSDGTSVEHVLRMVLEGVRNVIQHAHAGRAELHARTNGDRLHVVIEDDGVGFGPEARPPWSMASRIADLGGRLSVRSGLSGGRIEIDLPATARGIS